MEPTVWPIYHPNQRSESFYFESMLCKKTWILWTIPSWQYFCQKIIYVMLKFCFTFSWIRTNNFYPGKNWLIVVYVTIFELTEELPKIKWPSIYHKKQQNNEISEEDLSSSTKLPPLSVVVICWLTTKSQSQLI